MTKKIYFAIFVIILTSFKGYGIYNNTWENKVSKLLLQRFENKDKEYFLIYLNKQTRVQGLNREKTSRARFVFDMLKNENLASQKNIVSLLKSKNIEFTSHFIVNAISAYGDISIVEELAQRNDVGFISYDSPVRFEPYVEDMKIVAQQEIVPWGILRINADKVWELGYKGQGVVIGSQDTGCDWKHPALLTKYRGYLNDYTADHSYNWHDAVHDLSPLNNDSIPDPSKNPCGLNIKVPCDDHNHGTHTMGTIIGSIDTLHIGVAPEAKWIACRNMERGWGKPSTYIECFEWFMAPTDSLGLNPDPSKAPDVINNSWACPAIEGCDSTNWKYMEIALNNLRASGVFVVVSAGNNGINKCGSINEPSAIFNESFSVGATRLEYDTTLQKTIDKIASFSSRGPVTVDNSFRLKPNISAPGQNVFSSIPNNLYAFASGTSMAGPHVVGTVALILSAAPALKGNTDLIQEILENTAFKIYETDSCRQIYNLTYPNSIYGHGRIDAFAAVQEALKYVSTNDPTIQERIKVFPNPSDYEISIEEENLVINEDVVIYDILGKIVLKDKIEKNKKINVKSFNSGIYFLTIGKNKNFYCKKFVKI